MLSLTACTWWRMLFRAELSLRLCECLPSGLCGIGRDHIVIYSSTGKSSGWLIWRSEFITWMTPRKPPSLRHIYWPDYPMLTVSNEQLFQAYSSLSYWIYFGKHKDMLALFYHFSKMRWKRKRKYFLEEDRWRTGLSCIVNTMASDGLATQGARTSEAMVWT